MQAHACLSSNQWMRHQIPTWPRKRALSLRVSVTWALLALSPSLTYASPWVESHDPFLRASLHTLSDRGVLTAPVSTYPLRWSNVGDDVKGRQVDETTQNAAQHVRHAMANAQYGRGNVMAKALYQSSPTAELGYGSVGNDQWGIYSSYDHLDDDFSFRLNINYADSPAPSATRSGSDAAYDTDVNFIGSHLTFNAGSALVSIGYLERWWGPTWQHNVQMASFGDTTPSVQLSWLGERLPFGGAWHFDTVLDVIDQSSDYLWSNRLALRPWQPLELGVNYQLTDEDKQKQSMSQYGVDARLSLPPFGRLSHAAFANWQNTEYEYDVTAITYGWEGHLDWLNTLWSLVLEGQQVDALPTTESWRAEQQALLNKSTSLLWGDSHSIALYAQFANDHRMSLVYRDSDAQDRQETAAQLDYYLPFQHGMFNIGVGYVELTSSYTHIDEPNVVFGYEYRY